MAFTLLTTQNNTFAKSTLYHYKHDRTFCEILHVHNSDKENVCMFCVPSYPQDSSGLAHILEHTVLSGSQKFKVREPFYKMLKGSCKTFLNAMTYPDRTLYPVASTIKEDLFNLMDVYADAVWFPLLAEDQFRQEGFYFLHTGNGKQSNTDEVLLEKSIKAAGVVYNEMKGVYSDRDALVVEKVQTKLFPNNIYRFDSGGDPSEIPTLSYKQFKNFHNTWYRPEYTKIILYGNIPTQEYLDFLEKKHLSRWTEKPHKPYKPLDVHSPMTKSDISIVSVPSNEELDNTLSKKSGNKVQDVPPQYSVDITWVLPISTTNTIDRLSMLFLHTVILGIPGAPLRAKLLDTNIAEDISNLTGLEPDMRQLVYTIGLTGIAKKDAVTLNAQNSKLDTKIEALILNSLKEVLQEGIDQKLIEAVLHRIEFSIKESLVSTGSKINWLCNIARTWLYGGDIFTSSDPVQSVKVLTKKLKDPAYLITFAQKYLLDNMHRCTVIAEPNYNQNSDVAKKEAALLEDMFVREVKDSKLQYWQNIESQIEKNNNTEDDPKAILALPVLQVSDLPKNVEIWKQHFSRVGDTNLDAGRPLQFVEIQDNGIFYIWHQFDITDLIKENVQARTILPTLAACFTDLGTINEPYQRLASRIRRIAGRLSATVDNISTMDGQVKVYLSVGLSVLKGKLTDAIDLLIELFTTLQYDNVKRLTQIINEGKTSIRSRIISSGTHFAIVKAALAYSQIAKIDDDQNGICQLEHLLDTTVDSLYCTRIASISKKIFTKERLAFLVAADSADSGILKNALKKILESLPSLNSVQEQNYPTDILDKNGNKNVLTKNAYTLSSQVAFNALVFPAPRYTDSCYSAYDMTARIVSSKLWDNIRVQYGAYGAGCAMVGSEGLMELYTYRDPNVALSYEAFYHSLERTAMGDFPDTEIKALIIGMIGESLQPVSPISKAMSAYRRHLSGISDSLRQSIRDSIFLLEKKDIVSAAQHSLEECKKGSFVSFCSKEKALEQNSNKYTKDWQWDVIQVLPQ